MKLLNILHLQLLQAQHSDWDGKSDLLILASRIRVKTSMLKLAVGEILGEFLVDGIVEFYSEDVEITGTCWVLR